MCFNVGGDPILRQIFRGLNYFHKLLEIFFRQMILNFIINKILFPGILLPAI